MKWVIKSFVSLLLLVIFTWIFLVSLLVQAPAAWLVYQAQQGWLATYVPSDMRSNLDQLDAQAIQGRLGRGEMASLSWQLPWWRLALLHPQLEVQMGEQPLPWQLKVALRPTGQLDMQLQAGSLEVLQGLPLAFQGRLEGQVEARLASQQGRLSCQKLSGEWQGVARLESPLQVDLGRILLQPRCASEDTLGWQLESQLQGEHRLHLDGQASLERWSFQAQAEVHEAAPLASLLNMLGWRSQGALREGELAPGQRLEARGGGRF